jgi:hypothetical protein
MASKKAKSKVKAKAKTKAKVKPAASKRKRTANKLLSVDQRVTLDIERWLAKHGAGGPTSDHLVPKGTIDAYVIPDKTDYYAMDVTVVDAPDEDSNKPQYRLTVEPHDNPLTHKLEQTYPLPFRKKGRRLVVTFEFVTNGWVFTRYNPPKGPIAIVHYRANGQVSGKDDYVQEITPTGALRVILTRKNNGGYHLYNLWATKQSGVGSAELDPIIENEF